MAEKDKKYFWLKLQKDFFKRHDIRIVESMPNGKDYILFYLKLLCESIDHNGNLRFSEEIPYNAEMLATITNTNVDIVRSAVKLFTELKMMEILDDGTYYMSEVNKMLGSESYWAKKKREQRALSGEVGHCPTVSNEIPMCPSKSIEKDIDIESDKDKETKKDIEQEFESLWALYPRKVGKDKARKAYHKERKGNPGLYQTVEAGIKAYIAYIDKKKVEPQYIKHGSTWFNQKGWEDDYTVTGGGANGKSGNANDVPDSVKRWGYVGTVI